MDPTTHPPNQDVSKRWNVIYKTTFTRTGQYYVGFHSTDDLQNGYLGSGKWIRAVIRKHGRKELLREIVEFHDTREQLFQREAELLQRLTDDPMCMNMVPGGEAPPSRRGTKHTPQSIEKMRLAHLGQQIFGPHPRMKGRKFTDEHRQKIGLASKQRKRNPHTIETRERMSAARRMWWAKRKAALQGT